MNVVIDSALFQIVALKVGTEKPVDSILCADPHQARAAHRQSLHYKVLEPIVLLVGMKDVLLRGYGCRQRQPNGQNPN